MKKLLYVCVLACLSGCVTKLNPGAEKVMVVTSEAAVRNATLLNSTSGTIGNVHAANLTTMAKNYADQCGANTVLVRQTENRNTTSYTFEAWLR